MTSASVDTTLHPPDLTAGEAAALGRERYGLAAAVEPLPGERDQNFLLRTPAGDRVVLKISPENEDPRVLDFQDAVLATLERARTGFAFPVVIPDRDGRRIATITRHGATTHHVRLLRYVHGVPLARVRPHTPALLEEAGTMLGRIAAALRAFEHPADDRPSRWDLRLGRAVVRQHAEEVRDAARRALLDRAIARYDEVGAPLVLSLRTSVIQGDGNDHNILVSPADAADPLAPRRVLGLIDFGDTVRSYTVGDVAIAAAYVMMHATDPVGAAAHLARGFHTAFPLTEPEVDAVVPLVLLRLCTSVVLAARQRRLCPGNAYLSVSELPAWSLLEMLDRRSPTLAQARLRHACGLTPSARGERASRWLVEHRDEIGPVLDAPSDPARVRHEVLDLSVGSLEFPEPSTADAAPAWRRAVDLRLRSAGAMVGIGRHDEARRRFTVEGGEASRQQWSEQPTVHLGVDVFVPAGTVVRAPLGGIVAAVRDDVPDAGHRATLVLRHDVDDGGATFYSLYGGLVPGAQVARAGDAVPRGAALGRVAASTENGGWPPHLHAQLAADLLDMAADFPSVVPASQRDVWCALSPDPHLLLGIPESCSAPRGPSSAALLGARRERLGPSLSVAYRRPLTIVRGWMQHLFDDEGRAYLDAVNNVAHVGHSHPRVVDALHRQAAVLNTNTRYLHETILRYAERLAALLPEPLRVCYLVCSGSEANELALRLARAHTGRRSVVVIDHAYHGNTGTLVEISPYKFDGPGGAGAPPFVRAVVMPDPYRGPYRGCDAGAGDRYAAHVRDAVADLERDGQPVAAFFAEPLLGCGGQIEAPPGYLAAAFTHVRAAGGVCVADEVQVGFGRAGTHFWGFATQDAVPDIVTLGKPIGNGHPLGAVVTTPEIAASFANGMEYFNTFGGNPVSCAVGLAVLDVIDEEGLQARALHVGRRLTEGLRALAARHALIGDVRGRGLFLGVELVRDRETLEPAPRHAAYVIERMRDQGVLVSTDGPLHNVVKIKPPLVFADADADRLVDALDVALADCGG